MSKVVTPIFLLLLFSILASCSGGGEGYAVVLWPDGDSGLTEGEILTVTAVSESRGVVSVSTGQAQLEVDAWRVLVLPEREAAETFQEDFAPWSGTYGRAMRTALPVRERPDRATTRVYRLREGELVKVLDRSDEVVNEGGLRGYWYHVLTREGVSGWLFGYHLELTGAAGRSLEPDMQGAAAARLLEDIAAVDWRPDYYQQMITSGQIVLERFGPRFGLFGDPEAREVRIVLPDLQRTFSYEAPSMPDSTTIRLDGNDVVLRLVGDRGLEVEFTVSGRSRAMRFVRIEEDLQEVIAAERERRLRELEGILSRGNGLVSTAFGRMEISDQGVVSWSGYDRLVPTILPATFGGTATLEFSLFLSDQLRGRYDGAMRMNLGPGQSSVFLYTLVEDGLRLVFVPANLVNEENVVTDEPISPVVMFYRFIDARL
jgi:hypothetical protein